MNSLLVDFYFHFFIFDFFDFHTLSFFFLRVKTNFLGEIGSHFDDYCVRTYLVTIN